MSRFSKAFAIVILLFIIPVRQYAQQPKQIKVSELSVTNIPTIEERVFMVHSILEKGYFCYKSDTKPNTIDVYVSADAPDELSDFDFFYDNLLYDQLDEYSFLDKNMRGELFVQWRQGIDDEVFKVLYEDFTQGLRTENATCENAFPFCTDVGLYEFPAGTNSGSPCGDYTQAHCSDPYYCSGVTHQGQDNCLYTAPNPAFYYMRIDEPGNLDIYMSTSPAEDIDFDCWGPFDDITTACSMISCSTMTDCSYSADPTEHCRINNAQTGQYYILLITNYSNDPCNISFQNVGTGTTDCSILPPLVNGGGPYCVGDTIHLTAQNQAGATFSWSGPNNFTSHQQNPIIPDCTMEMAGIYTCTITVGDESSSAETEYVVIEALPIADFSFVTACEGNPVQFTSTSTTNPSGYQITSYEWNFGDGETGRGQTVSHTYAQAGDYEVTLTAATGANTCSDQKTQTVTVYAIPVATISATPNTVIFGGSATITVNVEPPGNYTYHWEPANMVVDPDSQTTQTVGLTETQVYTVTVTNTLGGCSSTAQGTVSMEGSNLTASASADLTEICEGSSTTLHALPAGGTGNYTYSWTPANTLSNPSVQNPTATPPLGTTTYTCHITDGITEEDASVTLLVHPNRETDLYESICENGSYSFFGQSLTTPGTYRHTLHTQYGCDSILILHLETNGLDEFEFTVPEAESCDSYFWDPKGHEYTEQGHTGNDYTISGTYQRTYKNITGCDSIVTMHVDLEYKPIPTPIYPMDETNEAPHWVVTATEFQINSYDFHLWDTNPSCRWDSVSWNFESEVSWVLEPFNEHNKCCKMTVLEYEEDTVWLDATAYNKCVFPDGVKRRYWFVCSFYGIEDYGSSTGSVAFDFSVVPNPNNGTMTLNFEHLTGKVDIKVYDMTGNLIDNFQTINDYGSDNLPYDMKRRAEGIYFFVATGKEGTVAKKVIIRN